MHRFLVELRNGWPPYPRDVVVRAPNMDCAFWVALYDVDPSDKHGYYERSVSRLAD